MVVCMLYGHITMGYFRQKLLYLMADKWPEVALHVFSNMKRNISLSLDISFNMAAQGV